MSSNFGSVPKLLFSVDARKTFLLKALLSSRSGDDCCMICPLVRGLWLYQTEADDISYQAANLKENVINTTAARSQIISVNSSARPCIKLEKVSININPFTDQSGYIPWKVVASHIHSSAYGIGNLRNDVEPVVASNSNLWFGPHNKECHRRLSHNTLYLTSTSLYTYTVKL
jgi:hypothetical protein